MLFSLRGCRLQGSGRRALGTSRPVSFVATARRRWSTSNGHAGAPSCTETFHALSSPTRAQSKARSRLNDVKQLVQYEPTKILPVCAAFEYILFFCVSPRLFFERTYFSDSCSRVHQGNDRALFFSCRPPSFDLSDKHTPFSPFSTCSASGRGPAPPWLPKVRHSRGGSR